MNRATLLAEVGRAASAAALGTGIGSDQPRLDGKRFEVRIRFGCAPAVPAAVEQSGKVPPRTAITGPFNVRFDDKDRTLRIRAAPDLTLDDQQVEALAGGGVEAVEGFWMYRPWLLADGCPQAPRGIASEPGDGGSTDRDGGASAKVRDASVKPSTSASHRVGLAQFFTEADPRTNRRDDRPYEVTNVLGEDERPSAVGYNLVLSGRLRELPTKKVISCRVEGVDIPPQCIVSAQFDRVRIENPETKTILAEWSN